MRPGTNSGSSDSGQVYEDQVKPDLLDFLFTLALTIGIAPELVGRNGLLSKKWILQIPDLAFLINLWTFLLAVSTLLFSWYGFNASIKQDPVLYGSVAGMLRFALDAFLVVLYGFLLIVYERLELVAALLVVIFALYTLWDALKLAEYRRKPFNEPFDFDRHFFISLGDELLFGRRSLGYFGLITLTFLIEVSSIIESLGLWKDVIVLLLLSIFSILYRVDKVNFQFRGDEDTLARVDNNYPNRGS